MDKSNIAAWFQELQSSICEGLEHLDGTARFSSDKWKREGGGGGHTRVIAGKHIEKGGVNFSAVEGTLTTETASALGLGNEEFFATGVSIVLHPSNPHVPIIHMNVRYFETGGGNWWFGGGIDVTPHFINVEEAKAFHLHLKAVCDKSSPDFYTQFKTWADDYFFLPHRQETRGIGGIFYDKLTEPQADKKTAWEFTKNVGNLFLQTYTPLFETNYMKSFTPAEKKWQMLRRGRYVEFNLVWDRGTKFGLMTNGRTESILMSLPATAEWAYDHTPEPGSREEQTQRLLVKGMDWISGGLREL